MKVKVEQLEKITRKALKHYGYSAKDIRYILPVLMYAQMRGNNQGVVKLIGRGIPKNPLAGAVTVVKETKLSVLLDGNHNTGMLVLKQAADKALKKAKKYGFGIGGTCNTASSTGAIGYYANEIAKQGYIGFVFAGSPELVNTHGSYEPIFGTNPLAIGVPTKNDPVVLDMTTAAMAYFGLVEAKTAERSIPEGIAYDRLGNITTDPAEAIEGAVRPFDKGHKGAGLAMIVEILTGPLVRASFTGIGDPSTNWGNVVFIIDPELLTDRVLFAEQVSQMVEKVKSTKRIDGVDEILVPGERGNKLAKQRYGAGELDIEENLFNELKKVGKKK